MPNIKPSIMFLFLSFQINQTQHHCSGNPFPGHLQIYKKSENFHKMQFRPKLDFPPFQVGAESSDIFLPKWDSFSLWWKPFQAMMVKGSEGQSSSNVFFFYKIPVFFTLTGPLMTTYISSVMLMMIMIAMTMMTIITNVMMMAMTIKNYSLTLMFAESDSD